MWQDRRSSSLEILDLGPQYYTQPEYDHCLALLGKINRYLGGFRATNKALKTLKTLPKSILEVGCGGGYLCHYLHKNYPETLIFGIDLSKEAIQHAKAQFSKENEGKIAFATQKEKTLLFNESSFDVVTTMLVCHHMTDEELVQFIKEAYRICSVSVIINDLHRHLLAYLSFSLIVPFVFPNRLIWNDGRLSIRRAFRKKDWSKIMEKAGFHPDQWTLKWNWAFRWTLTLRKT